MCDKSWLFFICGGGLRAKHWLTLTACLYAHSQWTHTLWQIWILWIPTEGYTIISSVVLLWSLLCYSSMTEYDYNHPRLYICVFVHPCMYVCVYVYIYMCVFFFTFFSHSPFSRSLSLSFSLIPFLLHSSHHSEAILLTAPTNTWHCHSYPNILKHTLDTHCISLQSLPLDTDLVWKLYHQEKNKNKNNNKRRRKKRCSLAQTSVLSHRCLTLMPSHIWRPGMDWDKNSALAFSVQTSPLHYQRTPRRSQPILRRLLSHILQRRVIFLDSS